jgi:hypothetical protein
MPRPSLLHPITAWRHHEVPPAPHDMAVRRMREAGGPVDEAYYSCECGCLFAASVSTSVSCPRCGATQAW